MEKKESKESGKEVYIKVRCKCGEFNDLPMRCQVSDTMAGLYFEQRNDQLDDFVARQQQQFTCRKCRTRIIIGADGENMFRPIEFLTLSYLSP